MGFAVSSSYTISAAPSSSCSSPASVWGPSHGRQFFTNFSNVSPSHGLQLFMNWSSVGSFHGVQSFRNKLLQCGSPMGSQALPENLLWHGLFSPWVLAGPCSSMGSQRGHSFHWVHPPAPAWAPFHGLWVDICSSMELHGLQEDSLPHHGLHHRLQGNLCSDA